MRLRVGTSGFSYKEWKGSFYPEDLPAAKMLGYYGDRFETVEINNTFYRMPKASVFEDWAKEVGKTFAFVLKAPMSLVHLKRSEKNDEVAKVFFETARALGTRLGPVFVQLPPHLQKDLEKLQAFFDVVPKGTRIALEVGHASWHDEDTYALLRANDASLCIVDDPKKRTPLVATASWGYLRLREAEYDVTALKSWVSRIAKQSWSEAFVFFKHEDTGTGPRFGTQFKELWAARASRPARGVIGAKR